MIRLLKFVTSHPLCRDQKASALWRVIALQIASRVIRLPVVVPFTATTRLLLERGMTGATGNYYCGLHEFEDMAFVLNLLRQGDLFVDIGANIGSYTILASGVCRAQTIAVEPLPATFGRLRGNVRINDLDDLVKLHNIGVGELVSHLRFTTDLDTVNHVLTDLEVTDNSIEVPVLPLDLLLDGYQPICIKIDVEGFEQKVINGGLVTFGKSSLRAVLIELNGSGERYGFRDEVIHDYMIDCGFIPYSYDPFKRTLRELQCQNLKSGNTLYLRDIAFVHERLATAEEIVLPWRRIGIPY